MLYRLRYRLAVRFTPYSQNWLPPDTGFIGTCCWLLVFGGFAVGLIVPPLAILWMTFA
jgi:hypothetical protein